MNTTINKIYLQKLLQAKDAFSIKIITGIRGIGKTELLLNFAEELKNQGIPSEQIIYINFDNDENIFDFQQLYEFVNEKIAYFEQAYLLFDEIQQVTGWEKAINAFFVGSPVDIYIASSTNEILSEDFLHLLSEHYELIQICPVSLNLIKENSKYTLEKYKKFGGLPIIMKLQDREEVLSTMLMGIYNTILNKEIISRYSVRDSILLEYIIKFLALNIGKAITPKAIEKYLSNVNRTTTGYTIEHYLNMIDKSGLFHKISRYDIKNRTQINGSERFLCSDIGIRNFLSDFSDLENEAIIKNVVCIELLRRGYKIFSGKINRMDIDFVAFKNDNPIYFQVTSKIESNKNLKKIISPLKKIRDQYDKIILSMEESQDVVDYDGVKIFNIFDYFNSDFLTSF